MANYLCLCLSLSQQIQKRLNSLNLEPVKIKLIRNVDAQCFITFKNEEQRQVNDFTCTFKIFLEVLLLSISLYFKTSIFWSVLFKIVSEEWLHYISDSFIDAFIISILIVGIISDQWSCLEEKDTEGNCKQVHVQKT